MLGNVILSPAPGGAKDLPHALARPRPVTPMLGTANDPGRWFCAGLVRLRLPVCGGRVRNRGTAAWPSPRGLGSPWESLGVLGSNASATPSPKSPPAAASAVGATAAPSCPCNGPDQVGQPARKRLSTCGQGRGSSCIETVCATRTRLPVSPSPRIAAESSRHSGKSPRVAAGPGFESLATKLSKGLHYPDPTHSNSCQAASHHEQ